MRMTVNATSQAIENIEVTEHELKTVKEMLATRPLLEILAELEATLNNSKHEVDTQLANMESRHGAAIREKQARINQLRHDLLQADNDLRDASARGKYSEAPAIEARKVEVEQSIFQAELALKHVEGGAAIERVSYLQKVSDQAGGAATLKGLPFGAVAQITRGIIWSWLNSNMAVDMAGYVGDKYNQARYAAQDGQNAIAYAEKALQDFRTAAAARYSGAGVKAAAAAQPAPPVKGYGFGEWGPSTGGRR